MIFPLLAALVFTMSTVVLAVLVAIALWFFKKPQRRYWRIVGWTHLVLFTVHLFVTFPLALGLLGSRGLGTRSDQRNYEGPRLAADGRLLIQTSRTLREERESGELSVPAEVVAAAKQRCHLIRVGEGLTIRAFRVESRAREPEHVAVLVHGLFRSALELEPVAQMLRDRDCECWLVDQRNHGGSGRAPFTGGLRESDDLVAVVNYVRSQPGLADLPLVLFGVSLGTVAVSLALPRLDGVAGVVLDAPIDDLTTAAHRMLTFERPGDRRSMFYQSEPWRSLVIASLELWSDFDMADVSPIRLLATLPHDLPVLVVSEEVDNRAPPDSVAAIFAALPMLEPIKELWFVENVGHGRAFLEQPAAYDQALARLLARLR